MANGKIICNECGKNARARHSHKYKNNYLCYSCWEKYAHLISYGSAKRTLEQALAKIYKVRKYKDGCSCSFPSILAGRKFKVQLVEIK